MARSTSLSRIPRRLSCMISPIWSCADAMARFRPLGGEVKDIRSLLGPGSESEACSRAGLASLRGGDLGQARHIGLQRLRHADRAVRLLVILQHRDQGAPDRNARAVQRMHEARLLLSPR